MRARSTLHDVAAQAGVSIATASRALTGLAVSQKNLERVKRAAAELHYVANDAARSLRNDRTMALGLIFFDLTGWRGLELLDALSPEVDHAGYSLLISTARGDVATYDRLMRRFLERRVDGLFCFNPPEGMETPARFIAAQVPLMTISGHAAAFGRQPAVDGSMRSAFSVLNEQLSQQGHRRAVIIDEIGRYDAFQTSKLESAGLPFEFEHILQPAPGGMQTLLQDLLARPNPPTIIAAAEGQANHAYAAAKALGLKVPGDLSIVALCNASDPRHPDSPLTSLVINPGALGRAAGDAMLAWVNGGEMPGDQQVEMAQWLWRETTGPVARSSAIPATT
jgi:LacI family transcriptional regulator